ncbi:MAG: YitT family protein [Firmicutes bacterium]|nr:YitT family protein [Bacillota bacterium]
MKGFNFFFHCLGILLLAVLAAVNCVIFIFPNSFAPVGINGICTMIQDMTQISMGYLSLVVNIPLMIAAFSLLKRPLFIKTTVYIFSFSIATVCLQHLDLSAITYHTDNSTSIVLAPIASGAIHGIVYAGTLKLGGTTGGTDIIASICRHFKPYLNLMNIIFVINILIALSSYFVYGFQVEPVICSIIYAFITSSISNHLQAQEHKKIKFEIIAPDADLLCTQIAQQLHRTATVIDAQGAYSGADKKMIVCVIERQKACELEDLIAQVPGAVFFKSLVNDFS